LELEAFARNAMDMLSVVKGVFVIITVMLDGPGVWGWRRLTYRGVLCGVGEIICSRGCGLYLVPPHSRSMPLSFYPVYKCNEYGI